VPTLIELVKEGLNLGIVSEGLQVKQWEKLVRLGVQHFFDVVVIAEENPKGKTKELFMEACGQIKCKPDECMMVGDRIDKDIAGANKAGLTTVQILTEKYSKTKPKSESEMPNYVVKSLGEVAKLVRRINQQQR
jgi:putative hydrolase of the HAD superfamily